MSAADPWSGAGGHGDDAFHPARHLAEALGRELPRWGSQPNAAGRATPAAATAEPAAWELPAGADLDHDLPAGWRQLWPGLDRARRAAGNIGKLPRPVPNPRVGSRHRRRLWVGACLILALLPAIVATPGMVRHLRATAPASGAAAILPSHAEAMPTGESLPATGRLGPMVGDIQMFGQGGWAQRLANGTILHTINAGQEWATATPPAAGRILAVAYIDARWAGALTVPRDRAGAVVIQAWTTADGGAIWTPQGTILLGALTDQVEGMVFDDPRDGWFSIDETATGFHGMVVYHTADGGAHWVEVARTTNG